MSNLVSSTISNNKRPVVLSIAGSDPSGGAGIQGDLKTILSLGGYGMAAITALTVQNTRGVFLVKPVDVHFLEAEIEFLFEDIVPSAVKLGMVTCREHVEVIAKVLDKFKARNIVIDPVISPTKGMKFANDETLKYMMDRLFTMATLITPNLDEARNIVNLLDGGTKDRNNKSISAVSESKILAEKIGERCGTNVLVKGGHSNEENSDDVLWQDGKFYIFKGKRLEACNNHGTGCALSSAIATNLGKGLSLEEAAYKAKEFVRQSLINDLHFGSGNGPINHNWWQ